MRTVAAFVLGLIVGVFGLGAALWATGNLQVIGPGMAVIWRKPIAPPPATLPDLNAGPGLPQAPAPDSPAIPVPPTGSAATTPSTTGAADRTVTEPGTPGTTPPPQHLGMPLTGVTPEKLVDTFHDKRNGHEHEALDIPTSRGTPVHAVAEGTIAKLFTSKEGGLTVYEFDNAGTYCFYYAHLDHYAPDLKEGAPLRRGDVIGYAGNTGDAVGGPPHLHFAVFKLGPEKQWWKGTALDPVPMFK